MATIGIDLGTTTTILAKANWSAGSIEAAVLRTDTTPHGTRIPQLASTCFIGDDGEISVGARALELLNQTRNSHEGGKRRFFANIKKDMSNRYAIYDTPIGQLTPQDISSYYLKAAMEAAMDESETLQQLVVTVPASFGSFQRRATREAVKKALQELGQPPRFAEDRRLLLSEPIAALLALIAKKRESLDLQADRKVLIYDLGGGTLDIALALVRSGPRAKLEDMEFTILEQSRYTELGGSDLDDLLARELHAKYLEKNSAMRATTLDGLGRQEYRSILQQQASRLKQDLCDEIRLMGYDDDPQEEDLDDLIIDWSDSLLLPDGEPARASFGLSWRRFDEIIAPLISRSPSQSERHLIKPLRNMIDQCIRRKHISSREEIDYLYAVGGCMLCPSVAIAIREFWGGEPLGYHLHNEAVSSGAAVYAALCATNPDFRIPEPPADAFWLRKEDRFTQLIGRNEPSKRYRFHTSYDAKTILLDIYSGIDEADGANRTACLESLRPEKSLRLTSDWGSFPANTEVAVELKYNETMELEFRAEAAGQDLSVSLTD